MRIAEKKMQNKDFVGARKIAIKDEQLYLDLEIISKMLTVCKIHYSTKHKMIGNDIDWHGILQIEQMTEGISKTTTQQNGLVSLPEALVVNLNALPRNYPVLESIQKYLWPRISKLMN